MNRHTLEDLRQKQALPLDIKVRLTQNRIRQWVDEYGVDGVYVSFSGGKDSTVLLHLVRELYPDVPAVFIDTGLEYPEIREFVKTFDNVVWLKPKMNFKKVIEKYGYPFISKETSEIVWYARKYLSKVTDKNASETDKQIPYWYSYERVCGIGEYSKDRKQKGKVCRANYSRENYKFFLDAPFGISHMCCKVMKKQPAHSYTKETGRHPIMGQMTQESRLRKQKWLQYGCNGFEMKEPVSNPMAFWTEQDVLKFIKKYNLKIASIYGEVVLDSAEDLDGQMDFSDLGLMDDKRKYKTTGCSRTGCMYCGFGCHREPEGEGRFERMKVTHPKQYEYIMKPWSKGGLGYKQVIDWINEHGNLHIRY